MSLPLTAPHSQAGNKSLDCNVVNCNRVNSAFVQSARLPIQTGVGLVTAVAGAQAITMDQITSGRVIDISAMGAGPFALTLPATTSIISSLNARTGASLSFYIANNSANAQTLTAADGSTTCLPATASNLPVASLRQVVLTATSATTVLAGIL